MPDYLPLWLIFLVTLLLIILAIEAGFRLGRYRREHAAEEKDAPVGAIVGAILGLLAFMLAFTFGMAASRFEDNRMLILDEANAIGTTYLRASLLPQSQRTEVRDLLRNYVDVRLNRPPEERIEQAIARSEAIQNRLWAQAVAAVGKDNSPAVALFIQSLNETIDLQAKRVTAGWRSRIPSEIWGALGLVAVASMAAVGYYTGLTSTRRSLSWPALALAFSAVMLLIADLERPAAGAVQVSRQALIDIRHSMTE
jgi:hypothetical protein